MEEEMPIEDIEAALERANEVESEERMEQTGINDDDLEILGINQSGNADDAITPAELIEMMEEAWLNEKFSPEIMPHKNDLVECILGQIGYMEENLENPDCSGFLKSMHQMELDRLRYLVISYLRNRVEKIEMFVYSVLEQADQQTERNEDLYLTNAEIQFAKGYKLSLEKHFNSVLSFWPGLAPTEWTKEYQKPNLHTFVFLKSKAEIEGVIIDEGLDEADSDLVDIKNNSQMIISYNSISNFVKNGTIKLI